MTFVSVAAQVGAHLLPARRRRPLRDALTAPWRGWTGKVALVGALSVLVYLVLHGARPWDDPGALVLSDFGQVPLEALGILLAVTIVVREARASARLAWALIGLALVGNLVGNVVYGGYELAGEEPFPSVADVFFLSFYPLMFGGLLVLPTASRRTELLSWRTWSNVAIVILGGGMAVLHFVLLPTIAGLTDDTLTTVISLAYPAGDLAILGAIATIAARRPYAGDRAALGFFIAGLTAWFLADLLFAIAAADDSYVPGSPSDLIWLAGDALFLAAAQAQLLGLPRADAHLPTPALSIARVGPYAMLALGLLTLVAAALEPRGEIVLLVVLAVCLTAIVVARQLVDERERRAAEGALLAEQSAAAAEAARQARHDPLTGLPNRTRLRETLDAEVAASTATGSPLTLVFVDLNLFKAVNDTLGHRAGDRLLAEVGRRLQATVRVTDTVARLGGDEFAIVLPGAATGTAMAIAERAKAELERPFAIDGTEVEISGAFGLATYPDGGAIDDDALMHQADTAMYQAKREHLGPTAYEASQEVDNGPTSLADLRRAIAGDGLLLHFQPIARRPAGDIVGAEALVRWDHPTQGLLGADRIVPLASQNGLLGALDAAVLALACRQARAWRDAGVMIRTGVNVSRSSVVDPSFAGQVRALLDSYGLPGEAIELEMTEDGLRDDPRHAARFVLEMRSLGVRTAIDDFGTGWSSLQRLRDLRPSALKIDRGFVTHALLVEEDAAIVESVVGLGHRLGMDVVAEGVEDAATLAYLDGCGVDYAQGFHIARPMSAEAVGALLAGGPARARRALAS